MGLHSVVLLQDPEENYTLHWSETLEPLRNEEYMGQGYGWSAAHFNKAMTSLAENDINPHENHGAWKAAVRVTQDPFRPKTHYLFLPTQTWSFENFGAPVDEESVAVKNVKSWKEGLKQQPRLPKSCIRSCRRLSTTRRVYCQRAGKSSRKMKRN